MRESGMVGFKSCAFFLVVIITSQNIYTKNAIVIGASSGMGREIAKRLSKHGYALGLASRRVELLESLQKELSGPSYVQKIDVTATNARSELKKLIKKMGGLDLIVISISPYLDVRNAIAESKKKEDSWKERKLIIDVCFNQFIAMADVALELFEKQNHGHLVGISSTSGIKGMASFPGYCGAKAGISVYMEGMRHYFARQNKNVFITDIVPGFVAVEHSPMGADPAAFWEISCKQAGDDIIAGILAKKKTVYVPARVQSLLLLKIMPDFLYQRFFNWL